MPQTYEPAHNDVDEVIPIADPSRPVSLRIENSSGEVRVSGTDREDIWVRAEKLGDRDSRFRIVADGNTITLAPIFDPDPAGEGPGISVDFDLDFDLGDMMRGVFGGKSSGRYADDAVRQANEAVRQATAAARQAERAARAGRKGKRFGFSWNTSVSYDIVVEVPRDLEYRLWVNSNSGEVEIRDLTGLIDLNTASGDLMIERVTGDLRANSASGSLHVEAAVGQLAANSASGDLNIEGVALNAMNLSSASGDINLDGALTSTGPYRIETVSGDMTIAILALNPASGADRELSLSFRTTSGDANLGDEFVARGGRRWTVPGSEAGPSLSIVSVSGELNGELGISGEAIALSRRAHTVTTREPLAATVAPPAASPAIPPIPLAPPMPPAPEMPSIPAMPPIPRFGSEPAGDRHPAEPPTRGNTPDLAVMNRLALLEAVERGEIDIEEALRQLDERDDA